MAGMHRIARIVIAGALACVVLSLAAPVSARVAGVEITFRDDEFEPKLAFATVAGFQAEAVWHRELGSTGDHNVASTDLLFSSGDPSGSFNEFSLDASAGTFKYVCEEHSSDGMKGTLKFQPIVEVLTLKKAKVTWATPNSTTGDRFDVQFRTKGTPKWKQWFDNTRRRSATFGANNMPIKVKPQRTYQLRVRSAKGTGSGKESGFSPPKDLKTGVS